MNIVALLDLLELWPRVLLTVVLVLSAIWVGAQLGRSRRRDEGGESEGAVGPAVGASLGLLAFLLAFTFGLAANRYDMRKALLLDEVNAIGTLYLRTVLLPGPDAEQVRAILREYVDLRVKLSRGELTPPAVLARSNELQGQIWSHVEPLAKADPHSTMLPLFITAANEVFDLQTKRITFFVTYRIPPVIWLALYSVAGLSMAAMGYHFGLGAARVGRAVVVIITLAFTTVVYLIADIDSPEEGAIRSVNIQPMLDLQAQIEKGDERVP